MTKLMTSNMRLPFSFLQPSFVAARLEWYRSQWIFFDWAILNVWWPLDYFLFSLFLKQVKEKKKGVGGLSPSAFFLSRPFFSARLQLPRAWNRRWATFSTISCVLRKKGKLYLNLVILEVWRIWSFYPTHHQIILFWALRLLNLWFDGHSWKF